MRHDDYQQGGPGTLYTNTYGNLGIFHSPYPGMVGYASDQYLVRYYTPLGWKDVATYNLTGTFTVPLVINTVAPPQLRLQYNSNNMLDISIDTEFATFLPTGVNVLFQAYEQAAAIIERITTSTNALQTMGSFRITQDPSSGAIADGWGGLVSILAKDAAGTSRSAGAFGVRRVNDDTTYQLLIAPYIGGTFTRRFVGDVSGALIGDGILAGSTAAAPVHVFQRNAGNNNITEVHITERESTGTPQAGYGLRRSNYLESSTTVRQMVSADDEVWGIATHANRTGRRSHYVTVSGVLVERMREDGENTYIGQVASGSYTAFGKDGTLTLVGDATVWDDLAPNAVAVGLGSSSPSFTAYNGNLRAYEFLGAATAKNIQMEWQMSHGWKLESSVIPHLHLYVPNDVSGGTIVFTMEYAWSNVNGVEDTPVVITGTQTVAAGAGNRHYKLAFPAVAGTGKGLSSIVSALIQRDPTSPADTFGSSVWLKAADIHIERDSLGSRTDLSK